jgi:hypothetical protein
MTHHRTLVRMIAALVVAGGMAFGAVAPATAAPTHPTSHVRPLCDTGWNGT